MVRFPFNICRSWANVVPLWRVLPDAVLSLEKRAHCQCQVRCLDMSETISGM
jgi:hypothetical protein